MSEQIVGIVKEVGQFFIGKLVKEDDKAIVMSNVSMLAISVNGSQVNIQFIPIDLLSINPPIGVKNLVKDPTVLYETTFRKDSLLFSKLDLSDSVIQNYNAFLTNATPLVTAAETGTPSVEGTPDDNIVKLF